MSALEKERHERARLRPAQLPLQGVKVVAIEQFGAGPYGTMFLAHLGATVIKIENPATQGDPSRQTGPHFLGPNDSQYFQAWRPARQTGIGSQEPVASEPGAGVRSHFRLRAR